MRMVLAHTASVLLLSGLTWVAVSGQDCDPVFNENCGQEPPCDPVFGDCPVDGPDQDQCDPVFGDCGSECDPVFGDCGEEPTPAPPPPCYSINEIDSDIFTPDTRQAVNVCGSGNCADYADYGYTCAPIWTCKNQRIITDGKGIIDVRSSVEEEEEGCYSNTGTIDVTDKKCPKTDEVCCKNPNFRATKCPKLIKKDEGEPKGPVTGRDPERPENWETCGRNGTGGLILTGTDDLATAQPGEFPHMCVIYRIISGQRVYVGGASLIAPNKLLTVAHKFWVVNKGETTDLRDKINPDNTEFYARCGEHNVKAEDELVDAQETEVVAIRIHPDYDTKRVTYNLAILITKDNFVYQEHIGPVCLPQPGEDFSGETECWSSGWGADAYDSSGFFSDILKKVQMPIVPRKKCQDQFRSHERFKGKRFSIHPSWMCVGGEKDSDTCKGDGGSPHVCFNKKNQYVQVGSVAWGIGCGNEIPSVYSNVPGSMCWIDWVMSCVPLADFYIDSSFAQDLRGSGSSFKSSNSLTGGQCGDWLKSNPKLSAECNIAYEIIDNRSVDQRST